MARQQLHERSSAGALASGDFFAVSQSSVLKKVLLSALATFVHTSDTYDLYLPCGDQTTAITTGTGKLTFRIQRAFTLASVAASLQTAGTGTATTFDINKNGVSILSTKLTIDATETTSATAAVAAVISDTSFAAGDIVTIDFDGVGTGAIGPVVYLLGSRAA